MQGEIIWYNPVKKTGIIAVIEQDGMMQKYFLLYSRVIRCPEVIKPGQYVKFVATAPPPKPGLLPVALAVEISDMPFVDAGVDALASKAGAV